MSPRKQSLTIPSSRADTSGSDVLDELIGMPGHGGERDTQPDLAAVPPEDPDGPAAASTSTAAPRAAGTGTRSRSRRQAKPNTSGTPAEHADTWAHQAVEASFRSARTDPRSWTTFSMRLPAELQQRVTEQMVLDREATDRPALAASHYLNAALASIPADPETAAAWAQEYIDQLGGRSLDAQGTGTRVHRDTRAAVRRIEGQLRIKRYGLYGYLLVAAVERFMDQLDAESASIGSPPSA
jgi:hypothetical protein